MWPSALSDHSQKASSISEHKTNAMKWPFSNTITYLPLMILEAISLEDWRKYLRVGFPTHLLLGGCFNFWYGSTKWLATISSVFLFHPWLEQLKGIRSFKTSIQPTNCLLNENRYCDDWEQGCSCMEIFPTSSFPRQVSWNFSEIEALSHRSSGCFARRWL